MPETAPGDRLEVSPHPHGPWFVQMGGGSFAVPEPVGRALRPLTGTRPTGEQIRRCLRTGIDRDAALPDRSPAAPLDEDQVRRLAELLVRNPGHRPRFPSRAPWLRVPLLPARAVRVLAAGLRPCAGWSGLAAVAAVGTAGYLLVPPPVLPFGAQACPAASGPILLIGAGLVLGTALWHEFGHAAALAHAGYPPGRIGIGILLVVPVLYAEVTAVGLLPRVDKVRVAAAGPVFQLASGGILHAAGGILALPDPWAAALRMGAGGALLAVVWSLLPFVRADGYWIFCDLLDADPDRPLDPGRGRAVRVAVCLHRLAGAAFLLAAATGFTWAVLAAVPPGLAALAGAGLLFLWWGLARRVARMAALGLGDLRAVRRAGNFR